MNIKNITILVAIIFVTGCGTTKLKITHDSTPRGASLICDGQNMGYTPITLIYTVTEEQKKKETLHVSPCQVKWISGVTAGGNSDLPVDLKKHGYSQILTYPRPSGDGYEKDSEFALQVEILKAQQRQATAAEIHAISVLY